MTTKKIVIKYSQQGMKKEFKHFTTKNLLNTNEKSYAGNEGQKTMELIDNELHNGGIPPYQ